MRTKMLGAGAVILAGMTSAGACVQVLGDIDFGGKTGGSGGGSGGTASTSSPASTSTMMSTAATMSTASTTTGTGGASTASTGSGMTTAGVGGGDAGDGGPVGGEEVWAKGLPDSFYVVGAHPGAIAIDKDGNTFVTGYFEGTLTLDSASGTSVTSGSSGTDVSFFLASFDPMGKHRWSTSLNAISDSFAHDSSVAVDAKGNVYWAGTLSTASVQIGQTSYNNTRANARSFLLASFDSLGTPRWAKVYPGADPQNDSVVPVAMGLLSNGDPVVTGIFNGSTTIGSQLTAAQYATKMFLGRFDGATGSALWANGYGDAPGQSNGSHVPIGLAVDSADSIFVVGSFDTSIQFGTTQHLSAGSDDIFVAKFSTITQNVLWSNRYGSPQQDLPFALAVDAAGAIFLTGGLGGPADLGGGNLNVTTDPQSYLSGFVAKFDGTDTFKWARPFGGKLVSSGSGYKLAAAGNAAASNGSIVVAAGCIGPVDFGGGSMAPAGYDPDGGILANPDVALAMLDGTGGYKWSKLFGDTNEQDGPVIAIDPKTQQIVAAFFNSAGGTVSIGKDTITSSSDGATLVLARFTP